MFKTEKQKKKKKEQKKRGEPANWAETDQASQPTRRNLAPRALSPPLSLPAGPTRQSLLSLCPVGPTCQHHLLPQIPTPSRAPSRPRDHLQNPLTLLYLLPSLSSSIAHRSRRDCSPETVKTAAVSSSLPSTP